jgi:hypothetical protein
MDSRLRRDASGKVAFGHFLAIIGKILLGKND